MGRARKKVSRQQVSKMAQKERETLSTIANMSEVERASGGGVNIALLRETWKRGNTWS